MSGQEKIVKEAFEQDAQDYLDAYRKGAAARSLPFRQREKAVKEMFRWENGRTLDVGSGPGIFTGWLLDRGCQVYTLDLAKEMVRLAELEVRGHPGREQSFFVIGSVENLPFANAGFDSILCIGLIEYVADLEQALKEITRVIAEGGGVVIAGPNQNSLISKLDHLTAGLVNFLFGKILTRARGKKYFEYPFRHLLFDPKELEAKMERMGFYLSERRYTNFRSRIFRGPFQNLGDRLGQWLEAKLKRTRLENLGTNYIGRFHRK